jgi:hypothetical protein
VKKDQTGNLNALEEIGTEPFWPLKVFECYDKRDQPAELVRFFLSRERAASFSESEPGDADSCQQYQKPLRWENIVP